MKRIFIQIIASVFSAPLLVNTSGEAAVGLLAPTQVTTTTAQVTTTSTDAVATSNVPTASAPFGNGRSGIWMGVGPVITDRLNTTTTDTTTDTDTVSTADVHPSTVQLIAPTARTSTADLISQSPKNGTTVDRKPALATLATAAPPSALSPSTTPSTQQPNQQPIQQPNQQDQNQEILAFMDCTTSNTKTSQIWFVSNPDSNTFSNNPRKQIVKQGGFIAWDQQQDFPITPLTPAGRYTLLGNSTVMKDEEVGIQEMKIIYVMGKILRSNGEACHYIGWVSFF